MELTTIPQSPNLDDPLSKIIEQRNSKKLSVCQACPLSKNLQVYRYTTPSPCDILVVGPSPTPLSPWDIDAVNAGKTTKLDGIFNDKGGRLVDSIISRIKSAEYRGVSIDYWYAVQCRTWKVDTDAVDCCQTFFSANFEGFTPKVVLILGNEAYKALGVRTPLIKDRGKVKDIIYGGRSVKVVPTFHPVTLMKTPGLIPEFEMDVRKAFNCLTEEKLVPRSELTKNYIFPQNLAEVRDVIDLILAENSPGNKPVAVDIETNSLVSHSPTSKIITISISWKHRFSTTIVLDHKASSPEYRAELPAIKKEVARLLESPLPKIGHNFKFDLKFLKYINGFTVNAFRWDTLLAEHLLEEERSSYKLKGLVRDYLPDYANYEETADLAKLKKDVGHLFPSYKKEMLPASLNLTANFLRKYSAKEKAEHKAALENFRNEYKLARVLLLPILEFLEEEPTFEDFDLQELCVYAATDADVTRQLAATQLKRFGLESGLLANKRLQLEQSLTGATTDTERKALRHELSKITLLHELNRDVTIPISNLTMEMEQFGVRVDKDKLRVWMNETAVAMPEFEQAVYDVAGESFKINDPKSLARLLYSKLGFEIYKKTPTGAPSVDEEALQHLFSTHKHPVLDSIIQYRGVKKCRESLKQFELSSSLDGFIHPNIRVFGTVTGRFATGGDEDNFGNEFSRINMQNLSSKKFAFKKNMKQLLIPSDPDTMCVGEMDLKTAEIMILVGYAPDKNLISAILGGLDTHSYTASRIYNISYDDFERCRKQEEVDERAGRPCSVPKHKILNTEGNVIKQLSYSDMRYHAKKITFGITYGAVAKTISEDLHIPVGEAQVLLDSFFNMFPAIARFMDNTYEIIKKDYRLVTYLGRVRRFSILKHKREDFRSRNQAINFSMQSTAADIICGQMIEMSEPMQNELGGRILSQTHDSIGFEYKKDKRDKLTEFFDYYITKRISEKYPWIPVPMKFDLKVGPNFGELIGI
jgi:uracil-DNA glycosylase family 4